MVTTDHLSYAGGVGCCGNDWLVGRRTGLVEVVVDTGDFEIAGNGDGESQMTMEAATAVGMNGHGIGVNFALEDEEAGMVRRGTVGSERCQDGVREVRRDSGGGGSGHGGARISLSINYRTLLSGTETQQSNSEEASGRN